MKNVVFLLVDSVFSECIGKGRTVESSTPFIDSLITEGLFASSVYSYGPYTDAATRGLYCGNKTLDDYGYFFGINMSQENHFKTFKENGYETIGLYYPYYLIGTKVEQYIDHSVFIGGFVYKSEWGGKFNYYAEIRHKRSLNEIEYCLLEKHLDLMFDCWKNFYRILDEDTNSNQIIGNLADENEKVLCREKLSAEYNLYLLNKRHYIDKVLDLGLSHNLNNIDVYDFDNAIDTNYLKKNVYKKYKYFFKKIAKIEFSRNVQNNKISLRKAENRKRYLLNWILSLGASKYMKHLSVKPSWQYSASMYSQINAAINTIQNRNHKNTPFYLSLHTEEPHNYITFFSYDTKDDNVIKEEIEYLRHLVDNCGKCFSGSLTYQLALRYVDLNVKRLVEKLRQIGELENTTIVITADHGSSYTFNPVRDRVVNNFHRECYKTPLLIWEKNMCMEKRGVFTGFYSAEDTLPTILALENLNIPDCYHGVPIFQNLKGRTYVITEYMGPGVPDMLSREVWMSIRNNDYLIAIKNPINEEFSLKYCCEVYDLNNDENELNNIRDSFCFDSIEINEMISALCDRFYQIKTKTKYILKEIDKLKLTK